MVFAGGSIMSAATGSGWVIADVGSEVLVSSGIVAAALAFYFAAG